MEPDGSIWGYILLLAVLILCNAFFAMSEIAIITLNDNKLRKTAEEGSKKAKQILRLVEEPSRFLATIQVGVTISGMLASAVAADTFTGYIVYALRNVDISPSLVKGVSLVVITCALSYFTLVLGELVPKRIAMNNAEKISFSVIGPLAVLYVVVRPFVALLSRSTNAILKLVGIDPNQKPEAVTEEEIRMMIDVGNENGNIEESNKDMINNIFEFDDRTVIETMTHRTEMTAVDIEDSLEEIVEVATSTGYSRIPVYEEDPDSILGILYVKDLLTLVMQKDVDSFDIRAHLREPLYVLESTNCKQLLKEFQERKVQMAIVIDEYGGTSGLVTMEDLLESIVGNIQDEYDDEDEEIAAVNENCYLVDGLTTVEDVGKYFNIRFADDEDFETIGGYVLNQLGYIPSEEEHPSVQIGDIVFTVSEMDERRISKLHVERVLPASSLAETDE
ncbi:hemolysin family protein [Oscillospiraceae bacterium MB08-C2-2]|nr:hemolysin family protein [Oscillospiraceae bacterium MB08-C2-2]